jgi:hypothetical protein
MRLGHSAQQIPAQHVHAMRGADPRVDLTTDAIGHRNHHVTPARHEDKRVVAGSVTENVPRTDNARPDSETVSAPAMRRAPRWMRIGKR